MVRNPPLGLWIEGYATRHHETASDWKRRANCISELAPGTIVRKINVGSAEFDQRIAGQTSKLHETHPSGLEDE